MSAREVLPVETWIDERFALRGPFAVPGQSFGVGYELAPLMDRTSVPAQLLRADHEVREGWEVFQLLRDSGQARRMGVQIVYTNASRLEDLGALEPDECTPVVGDAELTIYGLARSLVVRRAGQFEPRRIDPTVQPALVNRLNQAAINCGLPRPVDCDPRINHRTGNPVGRGSELVRSVGDAVRILELDPSDPEHVGMLFADLVYTNTLQWLKLVQFGRAINEFWLGNGFRFPEAVNLILPPEDGDTLRKLGAAGLNVDNISEAAFDPDTIDYGFAAAYQEAMSSGRIPPALIARKS